MYYPAGPTDGLLAGLVLVLAIGAAVGLASALIRKGDNPSLSVCIVLGMVGAFVAGFLLPAWGVNVSATLASGVTASAVGAVALIQFVRLLFRA